MSHLGEALPMPGAPITASTQGETAAISHLGVTLTFFSLSTPKSVNASPSSRHCWLDLSTFISSVLSCAQSCNLLQWFQATTLAVMRAHTTALGQVSQLFASQEMKDTKQHLVFGEKKKSKKKKLIFEERINRKPLGVRITSKPSR